MGEASRFDVVVVGGGHNGLVASWYLASRGFSVLVLEQREQVGGCCVTEEIFPGYRGNSVAGAVHSLDPRIAADMQLEKFGLVFVDSPLGGVQFFDDDVTLRQWTDRTRRKEEFIALVGNQRDIDAYDEFLRDLHQLAVVMDVDFYGEPPSLESILGRIPAGKYRRLFDDLMFDSVGNILERRIGSEHLCAFVAQTAMASNMAGPYTPGSGITLLQRPMYENSLQKAGHSSRNDLFQGHTFAVGGVGALTQAMAASCRRLGVQIVTNAQVSQIILSDAGVTGVTTIDGREFQASTVVANANVKTTVTQLLDENFVDPQFLDGMRNLDVKGSSAKVHLALEGDPIFSSARSAEEQRAFVGAKFRVVPTLRSMQNSYHECLMGRWSWDTSINGGFSSLDPSLTPDGCHFLTVSVRGVPYQLESGTWEENRDALGQTIIDNLKRFIPNLESLIADCHVYTPLDLERRFGLTEGNANHLDIMPGKMFNARPSLDASGYRTPVGGLYFCNTGVWPGNFISGVVGYNTARVVSDDLVALAEGSESILPSFS